MAGGSTAEGLLLVGHGSRSGAGAAEMLAIARLVGAALPDVAVDVGFLEMTDPPAGPVLDGLAAAGCRRVVVLPLVLLGAGHAKSDVPALVLEARARHPGLHVHFGSPLGISRDLVVQTAVTLAAGIHPDSSPLGITWLGATVVAMFSLAAAKARTGRALRNVTLQTEAKVTMIDGTLAATILVGLVLNAALGWWWADLAGGFVIIGYGLREGSVALRGLN